MQAVVVEKYGGLEGLILKSDWPVPKISAEEVSASYLFKSTSERIMAIITSFISLLIQNWGNRELGVAQKNRV